MRTLLTLVFLGSAAFISADQWGQQNNSANYQNGQLNSDQQDQYGNNLSNNDPTMDNLSRVSDQEISRHISDALTSGWFSKGFESVTFQVNNGIVLLSGSVNTADDKNKVEDRIRKISGVKQINDQITIGGKTVAMNEDAKLKNEKNFPQDVAASATDREINAKIRDKLNGGWFSKGFENLTVNTNNGIVTITGTVKKADEIQKINEKIKDVKGIQSINNQVTVDKK